MQPKCLSFGCSLSPDGQSQYDVVMWMDHRAKAEADFINEAAADNSVLRFVGGKVSLEMQTPKILWIKRHMPQAYKR